MPAEQPYRTHEEEPYEGPSQPPLPPPKPETAPAPVPRPLSILNLDFTTNPETSDQETVHNYSSARLPTWLEISLKICNITACVMFIVAIVNLAFAGVLMQDLKHDRDDYSCEYNYIKDASEPPNGETWRVGLPGKYHAQCRLLFSWSYILTVTGSLSMVRALLQVFSIKRPAAWTVKYATGSSTDPMSSASRIYIVRAVYSAILAVLYLVCIAILGSSRLITGPKAEDSYRTMYIVCLALLVLSFVVSVQQSLATAVASRYTKSWTSG